MSHSSETTRLFNCPDCNFSSSSQGGLCGHRTKIHSTNSSSVKSVSVVRSYPEGKNFICCLCGNTIVNFPNLKRHFLTVHPDTTLHYTTLHYTTLHYTTLHYTTLHYTTLHYTTLHYTTLHYTTLHYTTLHYTTLHYTIHSLLQINLQVMGLA